MDDKYFPIKFKNASINRLTKPWINIQAMNFINKKHKLFIALKRKLISYGFFKAFTAVLKIYLKRLKTLYYRYNFNVFKHDSKKL